MNKQNKLAILADAIMSAAALAALPSISVHAQVLGLKSLLQCEQAIKEHAESTVFLGSDSIKPRTTCLSVNGVN